MSTFQAGALLFVGIIFFGSILLGRYFRYQDEHREKPIEVEMLRPMHMGEAAREGNAFVYHSEDGAQLQQFMSRYYAELDRLAIGYHEKALLEGDAAADKWIREQTGRKT